MSDDDILHDSKIQYHSDNEKAQETDGAPSVVPDNESVYYAETEYQQTEYEGSDAEQGDLEKEATISDAPDNESVFYAETDYQQTEYEGSDDNIGSDGEDEGPQEVEEAGELPVTEPQDHDGLGSQVPQTDAQPSEASGSGSAHVQDDDEKGLGSQVPQTDAQPSEASGSGSAHVQDDGEKGSSLPEEALTILRTHWEGWKQADKDTRKKHWASIVKELRAMPIHHSMNKADWQWRLKTCLSWMHCQGRVRQGQGIRLGQKWTVRTVVREQNRKKLADVISEKLGDRPMAGKRLRIYQLTLTEFIRELPEEELEKARKTAEEWNSQAAPPEVQARFTSMKAEGVMRSFAEAMWKKGGIRMVVYSGWKDVRGEIFSQVLDFNDEIADGQTFKDADQIQGAFDRFLSNCFDPPKQTEGEQQGDGSGEGSNEAAKQKAATEEAGSRSMKKPKKKVVDDPVKKVTTSDGDIWIPEIANATRNELQALVRGFLTAHYRDACGSRKGSAPFGKLQVHKSRLFAPSHLPKGFIFPNDPSHLKREDAFEFLDFIRKRQETNPEDVFEFKRWIDRQGGLRKPYEEPIVSPKESRRCRSGVANDEGESVIDQQTASQATSSAYGGDGHLTDADGPTDGGTQEKVRPESEDGGNRGAEKTKHVGPRNNDKGKACAHDMEDGTPNVGPSSKNKGKAHTHDMEDAPRTDGPLSTRNTKTKHVGPSSKTKGKASVHNTPNDAPRKDGPLSSSNTKKGMAQAEDLGYSELGTNGLSKKCGPGKAVLRQCTPAPMTMRKTLDEDSSGSFLMELEEVPIVYKKVTDAQTVYQPPVYQDSQAMTQGHHARPILKSAMKQSADHHIPAQPEPSWPLLKSAMKTSAKVPLVNHSPEDPLPANAPLANHPNGPHQIDQTAMRTSANPLVAGQPRPMRPTKQSKVKRSANTTWPERTEANVTSAVTTSVNAPFAMGSAKESTTRTLPNQERPNQPPPKSAALTSANNTPLMPLDTSRPNVISAEKTTDLLLNSADQRSRLISKSTLMSKMQNDHLPRTSKKERNTDEESNMGIGSDQRSRRGHIGKSADKDGGEPDAITPRRSGRARRAPAPLDAEYDAPAITKKRRAPNNVHTPSKRRKS